jgi:hypothetical protein
MNTSFKDPLWRRALIWLGMTIICLADKLYAEGPINWLDNLRWKIEDLGGAIFWKGHNGSNDEARLYLEGDIPWEHASPELRERLHRDFPDYFEPEAHQPTDH